MMRVSSLLPLPASVEHRTGAPLPLRRGLSIAAPPEAAPVAAGLARLLDLDAVVGEPDPAATIALRLDPASALGDEGYRLEVGTDVAHATAGTAAGLFRAAHTLAQLVVPGDPPALPPVAIEDRPRFAWRGLMLDVARHFFGPADVKHVLDLMAPLKLNVLHLHLSDDQGWRIAIDAWPRLAEQGGRTAVGGDPGGAYTQADYRDIVAYAAERFITVVPELDTPGHTNAALAAHPELDPDTEHRPYTGTDVGFSSLRADLDITYRFLDDVFAELAALTPGPWMHLGGDEAKSTSRDDFVAFLERAQPLVTRHGKRVAGWEEMAVAALQPGSVIQYWNTLETHGPDLARAAVAQGAQVLMSPARHVYLDLKYDATTELGLEWAGHVEVADAYGWDPATLVEGVGEADVIGVEAALWTETVRTRADLETMLLPRLAAVAEVAWTPAGARGWEAFRTRLAAQAPSWRARGVRFHPSPQVDWPR
jgi:hexosaminidase